MTKNARWSIAVCDRDHGLCCAEKHDPRCRGIGEQAHHINYKRHIPEAVYWVIENGIWVSNICHDLAHKTHNGSIPLERRRVAAIAINAAILKAHPDKPELCVPYITEAA